MILKMQNLKLKPFMAYIEESEYTKLRKFSKAKKLTMSSVIREAISMRLSDSTYASGYNDGIKKSIEVVSANTASKMRFPSGKSFAELMSDDLYKCLLQGAKNG